MAPYNFPEWMNQIETTEKVTVQRLNRWPGRRKSRYSNNRAVLLINKNLKHISLDVVLREGGRASKTCKETQAQRISCLKVLFAIVDRIRFPSQTIVETQREAFSVFLAWFGGLLVRKSSTILRVVRGASVTLYPLAHSKHETSLWEYFHDDIS